MNVRRRFAHAAVVLALPALSLTLSSCGFGVQTDQVYNPGVGVSDQSGMVDVLNAVVVSGTDGQGTVVAGLANNDQAQDDALADVTGAGEDQSATVEVGGDTDLPAGGFLNLADEGAVRVSSDQVVPGGYVTLTFTFDRAAAVTVDVPVVAHANEFSDVPVDVL